MKNYRFLQLHLLTAYGPANLNRDDLGQPKSAMLGNTPRLRISSQSLKRAWRTSDQFESALAGHLGIRTKRIGQLAMDQMVKDGLDEKQAFQWSRLIAQSFGKLKSGGSDEAAPEADAEGETDAKGKKSTKPKKPESNEVETLVFLSQQEQDAVIALATTLAQSAKEPSESQLNLLRKSNASADLALFGRMLTADKSRLSETSDRPQYNVEAAAQVAHAVTIHRAVPEDDFFSAVDDLNRSDETGSGHLGELGFGAGVFYLYACVDRELLVKNLGGDAKLAADTLRALTECMTSVAPTGKQKSFASNARASFGLAELSDEQPRQLVAAFLRPVNERHDHDVVKLGVERLAELVSKFDAVYGFNGSRFYFNASDAKNDLIEESVAAASPLSAPLADDKPSAKVPRIQQFIAFTAAGLE